MAKSIGQIGRGLVVLLGVEQEDTESDAQQLADKTIHLRIFDDADGKMNLALAEVGGAVLVVSQFTLWAIAARAAGRASFKPRRPNSPSGCTKHSSPPWACKAFRSPPASSGR